MPKIDRVNLFDLESKNNVQKPQAKQRPLTTHLNPLYIMNLMNIKKK
jgi:hypothetical protein